MRQTKKKYDVIWLYKSCRFHILWHSVLQTYTCYYQLS
nr:MAG TPA_asm: hypothetical protein [Microviridae sp.]